MLHRVPDGVSAEEAALFVPMADGIRWAVTVPGTGPGDTVVVCGPGQQGLGCVVGALRAGAETVIVTGRAADAHRLEIAEALGATHTVVVDDADPVAVVEWRSRACRPRRTTSGTSPAIPSDPDGHRSILLARTVGPALIHLRSPVPLEAVQDSVGLLALSS